MCCAWHINVAKCFALHWSSALHWFYIHDESRSRAKAQTRKGVAPTMATLIDYLHKWEALKPDQTLFRFVDVDRRELERYTYQSFSERTRELAAYLSAEAG